MPQQEGIATIRQILAESPGTEDHRDLGRRPHRQYGLSAIARKMGAVDALPKPFDPDDLLGRISNCLKAA